VSETTTLTKFSHPETESHQNKHYPTQCKSPEDKNLNIMSSVKLRAQ